MSFALSRIASLAYTAARGGARLYDLMKLLDHKNVIFVGNRKGRAAVHWVGVAAGFAIFATAILAAGLFGWFLLAAMTGAQFSRGLSVIALVSLTGAAAVVTSVVTSSLRRPPSELPSLG
jgi:hypothetical protein